MERDADNPTEAGDGGYVLSPGDGLKGTIRRLPPDSAINFRHFKAGVSETHGAYGVFEESHRPGLGAAAHIHHVGDEAFVVLEGDYTFLLLARNRDIRPDRVAFVVLEGDYTFLLGERTLRAPVGSFTFIPRGTVHGFRNEGDQPGRLLAIVSSDEWAACSQEMGELVGRGLRFDSAELATARSRYPANFALEWVERTW